MFSAKVTQPWIFIFFSAMDSGLVRKAKDILNHLAFGSDPVKGVSQDYNKPLFIPAYSDSMQAILGQSVENGRISLDMWKHQYTTHFPQTVSFFVKLRRLTKRIRFIIGFSQNFLPHFLTSFFRQISQETALPADPAKDANFKEDRVDKLRAQKDDELERYRRTVERTQNRHQSYFDQSMK